MLARRFYLFFTPPLPSRLHQLVTNVNDPLPCKRGPGEIKKVSGSNEHTVVGARVSRSMDDLDPPHTQRDTQAQEST